MSQTSGLRESMDGPVRERVPCRNAPAAVQGFHCISCGEVFERAASRLPVFEDCAGECVVVAALFCREGPDGPEPD
jgi:hypothetical protein